MIESDSDSESAGAVLLESSAENRALMVPVSGEKILNKKAVYEPSSSQRCHQMVCNRRWTVAVLVTMGLFVLLIAIIAAFARPSSYLCQTIGGGGSGAEAEEGGKPPPSDDTTHPTSPTTPPKDYISTDGRPFPWKDIRLPRKVVPEAYHIFLHPNISRSTFAGFVRMHVSVGTEGTDWFLFHVKRLNVTGVRVLRGEVEVEVQDTMEYAANEQFYVKLRQPLAAGSKIVVEVQFHGALVKGLAGFYKSSYTTASGETREIATTQFEPTDARAAFPCFDEPDLKANFSLDLVREARHITLFNTPLRQTSTYAEGLLKDEYEASVRMSTYLVAFIVCDFRNLTDYTQQNTMVRVFAPEDQIEQARYGLEVAVKVLDHYNGFFGVPYPLPKQDLIAIPDFAAGAMENWGLITFRMTSFLYDPEKTAPGDKQWITLTIAHELAHQWFGNIVTMKWWDDLWLNEGFAAFTEYIGATVVEPSFGLSDQFFLNTMRGALYSDAYLNSHPIHVKVTDPAQINEIFDKISYDKGASIIAMLQGFIGEEAFKEGLHNYLTAHSYSNARTDDLWQSLQEASNMPPSMTVKDVMDTWTLQMGFPVVTVTRKPGTQHLLLSQGRFLLSQGGEGGQEDARFKSPFGYVWKIPVTYCTKTNPDRKLVWLKDKEMTLPVTLGEGDWIKFNLETKGFYRVNYEESLWRLIIQQLKTNISTFSVRDRAGLLDDAFALARVGQLSYDIVFDLLGYLSKETEYVPLKTAIYGSSYISSRIYLSEVYPTFQKYMLDLIAARLSSLGWEKQTQPQNELLQTSLLSFAVSLNHKDTIDKARQQFQSLSSLPKNQRAVVCNTGVRFGDEADWQSMFRRYTQSTTPTEKNQFFTALTYTTDPRRIQLFLRDSLNESIVRSQDTGKVIDYFGGSHAGQIYAWRFLEQNWDTYYKRYAISSFTLGRILTSVIAPFNTQFDYDEVKQFFQGKDLASGTMGLKQSLEMVQTHIHWIAHNLDTIVTWFQAQGEGGSGGA
ncbi:endoplasmic reticulum aminopeptidase 1-like isoform X2 [Babylonia areolata]|uniref:endoplasmic reticulum aminopeptidase 1-like isoform X2 n=1 Tax=Babylonia areolata TaxID=304850 RepID=UPI003FD01803